LDEAVPSALHLSDRYVNNTIEADHGRLKARLRPMRGRKRALQTVAAGHAFVRTYAAATTSSVMTVGRTIAHARLQPVGRAP
jgi:transposase-like protein